MIMPAAVRVVWLPSAATVDVIYTYTAAQRFLFFWGGGGQRGWHFGLRAEEMTHFGRTHIQ